MLVLAVDTCDSRGSVAVLREDRVLSLIEHPTGSEYSSWLLPSVAEAFDDAGCAMSDVAGYALAAGPGSFTGVRVGLTTAKAWAEVYGKPVAAVSRLAAIAEQAPPEAQGVGVFLDAQRGQVFGAVYGRTPDGKLKRRGDEMVIAPGRFLEEAVRLAAGDRLYWLSPDSSLMLGEACWKQQEASGERIEPISGTLAPLIGRLGARYLRGGQALDALTLDANYVRRSDAEITFEGRSVRRGC